MPRSAESVAGATEAATTTRRSRAGFFALAFPRFLPRMDAEIFARVSAERGACFQGSDFFFISVMLIKREADFRLGKPASRRAFTSITFLLQ